MNARALPKGEAAAVDSNVLENAERARVIAFAGNPNVGKSTIFNALTGLRQHTGNWAGKTVTNATGKCKYNGREFILTDLPGTYSLFAQSEEERAARDFLCFEKLDGVVVVCDATCLERNLNLVLQVLEITDKAVVCVNLADEAARKGINVKLSSLSKMLKVPVVATSARSNKGIDDLMHEVEQIGNDRKIGKNIIEYSQEVEQGINQIQCCAEKLNIEAANMRWTALRLLENEERLTASIYSALKLSDSEEKELEAAAADARARLEEAGFDRETLRGEIVSQIVKKAEKISQKCVKCHNSKAVERDRKIDKAVMSRKFGIPLMLALLMLVFWITLTGANYISQLLSVGFGYAEGWLVRLFDYFGADSFVKGLFIDGMFNILTWVIAVMLPPMAIFFPLFTILEDFGYLPRIAFNLDRYFKKARSCGKQALTMMMGFGCNAVGIEGCRIIDSPRERLVAMLTNNFVPCNGRFPMLISIITMFFVGYSGVTAAGGILSAAGLVLLVLFGIAMTFLVSGILSRTLLRGKTSSFVLELPPYRVPQFGKVIVRSVLDRTLYVLGRAVIVAAPAGAIIWLIANITVGDKSLLAVCVEFLDPFARYLGLDGAILMAFILGFPANEIVMPIIIMTYLSTGTVTELPQLAEMHTLLVNNGWTWVTALCTMLFSLMHWPCSTSCLTVKKETGSMKWTIAAFAIPTIVGMAVCFAVAGAARIFGA